jgi:hypothetical protein
MRHAVIMLVDVDVVIDPDTASAPFGKTRKARPARA